MTPSMRRTIRSRGLLTVVLSLSAAALFVAVAVPHYHGTWSASHPESTCRACRIQESFAATPAAPVLAAAPPAPVDVCSFRPSPAPRAGVAFRSVSPRAPPALS